MTNEQHLDGAFHNEPTVIESNTAQYDASSGKNLEHQLARLLERVPPFLRLPAPKARCRYTGLSRTALIDLIAPTARNGGRPVVKAVYRKTHRYAARGVWLVPTENLFFYLLSQADRSATEYLATTKQRQQDNDGNPADEALNNAGQEVRK